MTSSVKARADELVKSVVETDWKNELSAFSKEVGEESKTLKDKTAELVEHLPEVVEHLPEKVRPVGVHAWGGGTHTASLGASCHPQHPSTTSLLRRMPPCRRSRCCLH